jgi:AcrR family transcriptional regulator
MMKKKMAKKNDALAAAPDENPTQLVAGRALILDTAARLFRKNGFAATSLRDIATTSSMKAGSLYYHFASKDAIVAEVLRIGVAHVFGEVRRAVEALGSDAGARELIGTAVAAHLKALLDSENYTSANIRIFGQVSQEIRNDHLPLREEYEQFWADLLSRCSRNGEFNRERNLQFARFFIIGAMNATLEWFHPGKATVEEIAAELTAIFLGGVSR